jgi:enediyne polyketide synthase
MAESGMTSRSTSTLAVVGLACRFPDANDAPELLDAVLTGRRSFRRIPPVRLNLDDYYLPDRATSDATYSTRAALIADWDFDCRAFGIDRSSFRSADPAMWLALETTARALAGAGLTAGTGLGRDRTGVIIGNSLGGEVARANALRARWPYVRRVLAESLSEEVAADKAGAVLRKAERRYLAPFPAIGPDTIVGSTPGAIAAAISGYFGFRGPSHAIDSACSSSLQAVATACTALIAGDLDAVVAGGVDINLDPSELIGLAKAGVLATDDVRIYDETPTGYLPAEGCGVVVLMRTADARTAGLPVYAEIVGWGVSASGGPGDAEASVSSQLLAMRRAYERAEVDPGDVQLFEGNGASTKEDDDAELIALEALRAGARREAALGSVKANIGHAKAAAGSAGLIKAVLALSTGVLPPATGASRPHALISGGMARLTLPPEARDWPAGSRIAAVSALDSVGSNVHLVLRTEPAATARQDRWTRPRAVPARTLDGDEGVVPRMMTPASEPMPYFFQAPDRFALASLLTRIADIARWLSDAELQDLACLLGREPTQPEQCKAGLVAAGQDQLAARAGEAATLLPRLADGLLTVAPGIFAADGADGRVTLLLSGETSAPAAAMTESVTGCLDALRWLESLDVHANGAVGHGLGALAGLAWAGVLGEGDVAEIAALRAQFLDRSAAPSVPAATAATTGPAATGSARASGPPAAGRPATPGHVGSAALRAAIAQKFRLGPPRRRLLSTLTGAEIGSVDDAIDLICSGFSGADKVAEAIGRAAIGATLLFETGPGRMLATAAAATKVPAVSLEAGLADPASAAHAAAALFASGALSQPRPLFAGRPSRPIDIWRERTFIASPCEMRPKASVEAADIPAAQATAAVPTGTTGASQDPAEPAKAGTTAASTASGSADAAESDRKSGDGGPGLSGLRTEFERRLPDRPLIAAATASASNGERPPGRTAAALTTDQITGVPSWAGCFGETLTPADRPARAGNDEPWRTHIAGPGSVSIAATRTFRANDAAARTLAIIGDPADEESRAVALQAARDAIDTGQLVVLTTSPGFTGFFASLHAEHPALGITVLRVPAATNGLSRAKPHAYAEPGTFRELVLARDGSVLEPALSQLKLAGGGPFPLGTEDVVLVSRGARGAGLALAQVLACCGTPVAVIGRAGDGDDSELVAGLEQLRSAGARIGYEVIDMANAASLAAAVERVESRLGPVAAIGHAVGYGSAVPLTGLTDIEISDHVAAETATLDHLVAAVKPGQLRMIVTFGSVAGRYGLAGGSALALATGALAGRAGQLATAASNCRSLHVDIPAWSTQGLGDRPELADELAATGTAPIAVGTASRLLLKAMTTHGLPERIAVHGRVSGPAAWTARPLAEADLAAAGLTGGARFLQEVRAHYPANELVCSARLSVSADPYLADYHADGLPVLPEVLALEALAEAASVLAGRPLRSASDVRLDSPVVIPPGGEAEVRICAQRTGSSVTAVLRCRDSSYATDHARAVFSCSAPADGSAAPQLARAPSGLPQLSASPSGLVDGAELYGPIAFQSGRFRRIALLPEVTARSCRALARGGEDQPWFDPAGPVPAAGFVLGSPGLADASVQAIQASVPYRRIRPAGCESVTFSGKVAEGAVEIRAIAVPSAVAEGGEPVNAVPAAAVGQPATSAMMSAEELADQQDAHARPRPKRGRRAARRESDLLPATAGRDHASNQAAGGAHDAGAAGQSAISVPPQARVPASETVPTVDPGKASVTLRPRIADERWDVEAVDSAGDLLIAWRGLRLHDGGPLPRNAAWPPPLLSIYLERGGRDLGLDAGLRVTVGCGQPQGAEFLATAVPRQAVPHREGSHQQRPQRGGAADPVKPEAGNRKPAVRAGAGPNVAVVTGTGPLAGFTLTATSRSAVACGWTAVEPGHRHDQPTPVMAAAYARLRGELAEPPATLAARLHAIGACLTAAGMPEDEPLSCEWTTSEGWAVVTAGAATVACTIVEVSGVASPVAIAILTGPQPAANPRDAMATPRAADASRHAPGRRMPAAQPAR